MGECRFRNALSVVRAFSPKKSCETCKYESNLISIDKELDTSVCRIMWEKPKSKICNSWEPNDSEFKRITQSLYRIGWRVCPCCGRIMTPMELQVGKGSCTFCNNKISSREPFSIGDKVKTRSSSPSIFTCYVIVGYNYLDVSFYELAKEHPIGIVGGTRYNAREDQIEIINPEVYRRRFGREL